MNWTTITDSAQTHDIFSKSYLNPIVIFKHSTRCSLSAMILRRLEREYTPVPLEFYLLDLIANRMISNLVAEKCDVRHESPQLLLIKNGKCIYHESHSGITMDDITRYL